MSFKALEYFINCFPQKRASGAKIRSRPAVHPFRETRWYAVIQLDSWFATLSGGQNLAALCTAAGQNLAAVGGSHSLAETVDLGTMTTAGLVGTLHLHYTSCQKSIMLNSRKRPQQHIITMTTVMLNHYNRKKPFGQPLFRIFPEE